MTGRFTAPRVQRFPINTKGRDFVIGDIHGAFSLVWQAMCRVKFDPSVDRIFAAGDLIDRGEESHRCARFLSMPYVHAVRGNHEDLIIEMFDDGEPHPAIVDFMTARNGFGWWHSVPEGLRQEILIAIRRLPLVIEIETIRGTVGLVHADVPKGMPWQQFLSEIESGNPETIETCLWGRDRIERNDHSGVPGVGRLFIGHTLCRDGLNQLGNVFAVDTAAIYGLNGNNDTPGHLTMARIEMPTGALIAPKEPIDRVDVRDGESIPRAPFGHYSTTERTRPRA